MAWFHCFAGIAGDMALGALLDAGADVAEVRALLGRLPRLRPSDAYDPRFSNDRFGVAVRCAPGRGPSVAEILRAAGAEEVRP